MILLVGIGIIIFLFVEGLIISAFHNSTNQDVDYLLVLGAQVKENGPSNVLRYRLDIAKEYLDTHPTTKCIVSGGQGYNEPYAEAIGMQKYLCSLGIAEERIILEPNSKNTVENIHYSMQLFDRKKDSVAIITNNFHLYRAIALAKKAGIKHIYGIPAKAKLIYLPNNMLREFVGMVKDFMFGNI